MWSDPNRVSYMAVTAHWITKGLNGDWMPQTRLLAFKHVKGSHSGVNLAHEIFEILKSAGILHKVWTRPWRFLAHSYHHSSVQIGSITMDNASHNDTTMSFLAIRLAEEGVPFEKNGNRIRYVQPTRINKFGYDIIPHSLLGVFRM